MPECRLIVHADDLGISERVSEGIVAAHLRGIVTSTSLIAPGAAFSHAIRLIRSTPTLDVGVHLTLTEETPVARPGDIPTLLNNEGRFHADADRFLKLYLLTRVSLEDVRRELDAQIEKVVSHGVKVSHLDGHQHLHMLPGIRRTVGQLAKKHGIPAVRFPREALRPYMLFDRGSKGRLLQLLALNAFCVVVKTAGATRPDHFFGFFFGGRLTKQNLIKVLECIPHSGTCELMCHPGFADPKSSHSHWRYRWQDELDALTDQDVRQYLETRGVELISYRTLTET